MIEPGVERKPQAGEDSEAFAEGLVGKQAGRWAVGGIADGVISIPGSDVTDAAEAVSAGTDMGRKHRLDTASERQIRVADNAGAHLGLAVDAAGAHGGDAVDELGLAYGAQLFGAGCSNHGPGLHEHRRDDVVTGAGICQQLIEQIAPAGPVPQVVVRINDRQLGLEDRLLASVEPILADGNIGREEGDGVDIGGFSWQCREGAV